MEILKKMREYNYHIGLQLRIYPSDSQKKIIRINGGASRYIYNKLVADTREIWKLKKTANLSPADKERLDYLESVHKNRASLINMIPFLNIKDIDFNMIDQALANYRDAWHQYKTVKGISVPSFHKKDNTCSYGTSNHFGKKRTDGLRDGSICFLDSNHIQLPKIGRIRFKGSKKLVEAVLNRDAMTRIGIVTVYMDATGDCYASLSLASDTPFHQSYAQTGKAVGMDVNLTNFLTDSDGTVIENMKFFAVTEAKLKKESAKKDKRDFRRCKNYREQRLKVAELHKKVTNQRLDFIRNVVNMEVKNHDYLFAEDLKVRNLLKNHRLAQAITDCGWRKFLTELEWGSSKRGKICLLVNPKTTTQTCSLCGYVSHGDTRIELGVEEWDCPQCGTHHIRDYNVAVNIKNAGLLMLKEAGVEISLS